MNGRQLHVRTAGNKTKTCINKKRNQQQKQQQYINMGFGLVTAPCNSIDFEFFLFWTTLTREFHTIQRTGALVRKYNFILLF